MGPESLTDKELAINKKKKPWLIGNYLSFLKKSSGQVKTWNRDNTKTVRSLVLLYTLMEIFNFILATAVACESAHSASFSI